MDFNNGNYPDDVVNGGFDGCVQECREDEVLIVDPRLGEWNCVPKVVNATLLDSVCPGKFNTGKNSCDVVLNIITLLQSVPVLGERRSVSAWDN